MRNKNQTAVSGPLKKVAALQQKEQLKALRRKTGLEKKEKEEPNSKHIRGEGCEKHQEVKWRNYVPEDKEQKKRKLPQVKLASAEEKVQLEAEKSELSTEETNFPNLAPRKPDWDLKRDVTKKLEKLEKRTQRAIAETIQERLLRSKKMTSQLAESAKQEESDSI